MVQRRENLLELRKCQNLEFSDGHPPWPKHGHQPCTFYSGGRKPAGLRSAFRQGPHSWVGRRPPLLPIIHTRCSQVQGTQSHPPLTRLIASCRDLPGPLATSSGPDPGAATGQLGAPHLWPSDLPSARWRQQSPSQLHPAAEGLTPACSSAAHTMFRLVAESGSLPRTHVPGCAQVCDCSPAPFCFHSPSGVRIT